MSVVIDASGVEDLEDIFQRWPDIAAKSMSIAINETARDFVLPLARREINEEVAFPVGYLDDPDRLSITQFATPTRLEAVVTGRDRATSLRRFVVGDQSVVPTVRGTPRRVLNVMVKPGVEKPIPKAYLINLRNGNIGFAIRLRPGETVKAVNSREPVQIFPGVFLLYGPSVDQVLTGAAEVIAPKVTEALEKEFVRQLDLRLNGNPRGAA